MSNDILAIKVAVRDLRSALSDLDKLKRSGVDLGRSNESVARAANSATRAMKALGKADLHPAIRGAKQLADGYKNVGRSASQMGSLIGKALGAAAGIGIGASVMGGIKALESKAAFERSLKFNLGDSGASIVQQLTDSFANKQGLGLSSTRSAAARLAGTGALAPNDIVDTLRAFTALGSAGGANAEAITRAFEQYAQVAGQGALQGDELRAMQEAGVNIRKLLADAGLGGRIGDQKNPLSFDEINKVLLAFGKRGDVDKLLADQANQTTSALQRLANTVETDVLVPFADALAPAIKDLAASAQEFVHSVDPEAIRKTVHWIVDHAKAMAVLTAGTMAFVKGAQLLHTLATIRATAAMNALAASTSRAAVANAVGGGGGAAGAAKNIIWTGSAAAAGEGGGVLSTLGGIGVGTGAAISTTAIAGAEAITLMIHGIERLAGVRTEDSFIYRLLQATGQAPSDSETRKIDAANQQVQQDRQSWLQKQSVFKRMYGWTPTRTDYARATGDDSVLGAEAKKRRQAEKDKLMGRSTDSPRASSFDNQTAEANARALRRSL